MWASAGYFASAPTTAPTSAPTTAPTSHGHGRAVVGGSSSGGGIAYVSSAGVSSSSTHRGQARHAPRVGTPRDAERRSAPQGQLVRRPSLRGRAPYRHDAQQPSHYRSETTGRRAGRDPARRNGRHNALVQCMRRRGGARRIGRHGGGLGDASGELWKSPCESTAALRAPKRARRRGRRAGACGRRRGRRAGACGAPQPSSPRSAASSLARASQRLATAAAPPPRLPPPRLQVEAQLKAGQLPPFAALLDLGPNTAR